MLPFPGSKWLYKPPPQFTRINWANPITRGLSAVLLPSGGPLINYVNGQQWVYRNGSGTVVSPIYLPGKFGTAIQIGTSSQYELTIPIGSNPTDRSFIALHTPVAGWIADGSEVGMSVFGGTTEHIGIKSYVADEFDGATHTTVPAGPPSVLDIGQKIWVAQFAQSNDFLGVAGVDDHPTANLNYVNFGSDVAVVNLYASWTGLAPVWAINHPGTGGNTDNDAFFYAYFWTRKLTKAEVIELYHDPYCILMPPSTWWAGINTGPTASPFNGAIFENPRVQRVAKDKSYFSLMNLNLKGKDTFFGAAGQAPTYDLGKPTKLKSNARLNFEHINLSLHTPVAIPFIVSEDTRPRRRKTNTFNFESASDLGLITVSVVPFIAYEVDRKFLKRNRDLDWINNTNLSVAPFLVTEAGKVNFRRNRDLDWINNADINLLSALPTPFLVAELSKASLRRNRDLDWISNADVNLLLSSATPFLVSEVTIPRRLLRKTSDFNEPVNLNLLGQDTFFGAPGQAPLFDLRNPNTHRSNARLNFELPLALINRIVPPPADDTTSLLLFANLHIRLDVKREMDSGSVDALASDAAGTPVTFNKAFLDVDSITLTVAATQPITAIYDFLDVPNPTGFSVYAYDSSGNRVDFTISWKARGIV